MGKIWNYYSPCKKNYGRNKKRQLKLTKRKLTQNKKCKIETKTTSKNKKTKTKKSKKEINAIRQQLTFPGCRGASSKSFLSSGSVKAFWIGPKSSLFPNSLISVWVRILLYSYFDISATFKEKMIFKATDTNFGIIRWFCC